MTHNLDERDSLWLKRGGCHHLNSQQTQPGQNHCMTPGHDANANVGNSSTDNRANHSQSTTSTEKLPSAMFTHVLQTLQSKRKNKKRRKRRQEGGKASVTLWQVWHAHCKIGQGAGVQKCVCAAVCANEDKWKGGEGSKLYTKPWQPASSATAEGRGTEGK